MRRRQAEGARLETEEWFERESLTGALTDTERNALSRYPLVVALSVQTPGNVNLLHGALPAPAPAQTPPPALPR